MDDKPSVFSDSDTNFDGDRDEENPIYLNQQPADVFTGTGVERELSYEEEVMNKIAEYNIAERIVLPTSGEEVVFVRGAWIPEMSKGYQARLFTGKEWYRVGGVTTEEDVITDLTPTDIETVINTEPMYTVPFHADENAGIGVFTTETGERKGFVSLGKPFAGWNMDSMNKFLVDMQELDRIETIGITAFLEEKEDSNRPLTEDEIIDILSTKEKQKVVTLQW